MFSGYLVDGCASWGRPGENPGRYFFRNAEGNWRTHRLFRNSIQKLQKYTKSIQKLVNHLYTLPKKSLCADILSEYNCHTLLNQLYYLHNSIHCIITNTYSLATYDHTLLVLFITNWAKIAELSSGKHRASKLTTYLP